MVSLGDALLVLGYPVGPTPGGADAVVMDGAILYWPAALGTPPTAAQVAAVTQQQVNAYHVQQRRNQASQAANAPDPESVRLRAVLRVILSAFAERDAYLSALHTRLLQAGLAPASPPPPTRTWAQLKAAVNQVIQAGQGDPDPP